MVEVRVKDFASFDDAIKKFMQKVERSGLKRDAARHTAYEKPSIKRRHKHYQAVKRARKQMLAELAKIKSNNRMGCRTRDELPKRKRLQPHQKGPV